MRILLVEDDAQAAHVLSRGLREESYAVDVASDGQKAVFQAGVNDYDAVILDLLLPVMSGLAVCRTMRASGCQMPILMLTARDTVESRVAGLDAGADDYLVKPYDFRELTARLRALIRRGHRPAVPDRLKSGALTIDTRQRCVWMNGVEVLLRAKEYALLEYLARRAGEVVGRGDIVKDVWDGLDDPQSNVVEACIKKLRRRLDPPGAESIIQTHRGVGYSLGHGAHRAGTPSTA